MGYRLVMTAKKAAPAGKASSKTPKTAVAEDAPVVVSTEELIDAQRASLDNAASNANLM